MTSPKSKMARGNSPQKAGIGRLAFVLSLLIVGFCIWLGPTAAISLLKGTTPGNGAGFVIVFFVVPLSMLLAMGLCARCTMARLKNLRFSVFWLLLFPLLPFSLLVSPGGAIVLIGSLGEHKLPPSDFFFKAPEVCFGLFALLPLVILPGTDTNSNGALSKIRGALSGDRLINLFQFALISLLGLALVIALRVWLFGLHATTGDLRIADEGISRYTFNLGNPVWETSFLAFLSIWAVFILAVPLPMLLNRAKLCSWWVRLDAWEPRNPISRRLKNKLPQSAIIMLMLAIFFVSHLIKKVENLSLFKTPPATEICLTNALKARIGENRLNLSPLGVFEVYTDDTDEKLDYDRLCQKTNDGNDLISVKMINLRLDQEINNLPYSSACRVENKEWQKLECAHHSEAPRNNPGYPETIRIYELGAHIGRTARGSLKRIDYDSAYDYYQKQKTVPEAVIAEAANGQMLTMPAIQSDPRIRAPGLKGETTPILWMSKEWSTPDGKPFVAVCERFKPSFYPKPFNLDRNFVGPPVPYELRPARIPCETTYAINGNLVVRYKFSTFLTDLPKVAKNYDSHVTTMYEDFLAPSVGNP